MTNSKFKYSKTPTLPKVDSPIIKTMPASSKNVSSEPIIMNEPKKCQKCGGDKITKTEFTYLVTSITWTCDKCNHVVKTDWEL